MSDAQAIQNAIDKLNQAKEEKAKRVKTAANQAKESRRDKAAIPYRPN